MQGRLLPKFKGLYQAHPKGYWQDEFEIARGIGLNDGDFGSSKNIIESLDVEIKTAMWQCIECLEMNDETFDYCWNCKRDKS